MVEQFKVIYPQDKLQTFDYGMDAIEHIKKSPQLPFMIFCDVNMSRFSGTDLLDLIKRDPKLHQIPVVLVSAELDQKTRIELEQKGAFQLVPKPFQGVELKSVVDRYLSQAIDVKTLESLDVGFTDDAIDLIGQAQNYVGCKDENSVKELFRIYHTIKGGVFTLQFPSVGVFVHLLENVLMIIGKYSIYSHEMVSAHLRESHTHLLNQLNNIKQQKLLDPAPEKLVEGLTLTISNAKTGWLKGNQVEKQEQLPVEIKNPSTLRIANEKMDELQQRFKKLQQIRVKMNQFAQELKREFSDEGFPNQLIELVSDMEKQSMGIMDFFITLRVIPVARLKAFATQTALQTSDMLKKKINFIFNADESLEVDQAVLEVLETSLTHLIRNSIDHGIEIREQRFASGKNEIGQLTVEIIKDSRESFIMKIADDGAGINADRLREMVSLKGIMEEKSLRDLPNEKIYEFIFLDGLSTKQGLTEISGRGVGLSAVKDRILQLGGTIDVISEWGKGTSFEIRMPRVFQL